VIETETIPRDPALQPFRNLAPTANAGASLRVFLTRWMSLELGVRDQVFTDRFEATDPTEVRADDARPHADRALVHAVVLQAGLGLWTR
jgi:hypothetical protein